MASRDLPEWQHKYGSITTDVKDAQAALGDGLDNFNRTHSTDDLAAVVASFDKVMARAQGIPPVPDTAAAKLFAEAIAAWRRSGTLLVAGIRAVDTDQVGQAQSLMADGASAWGRFGEALEALNDLHRDPLPAIQPLAPKTSDATVIALPGPAPGGHGSIKQWYRQNRSTLPGFLVALGFGLAGVVAAILGLATGQAPIAGAIVILVICLPLLVVAVGGAWLQGWMRRGPRFADDLIIDGAGIRRTNPAVRFDVPWATVREIQVLTAETFRGETSPWKLVARRTGSSIALGFVPRSPQSFATAHPGLSAGPMHDRFPGLQGNFGSLLGVLTMRSQRTIEAALRQHAVGLFTGTVDSHAAVRQR